MFLKDEQELILIDSLRNLWQAQQIYYCRSTPCERPEVHLEVSMSQTNRCWTGTKITKATLQYDKLEDSDMNDVNDMPNDPLVLHQLLGFACAANFMLRDSTHSCTVDNDSPRITEGFFTLTRPGNEVYPPV